MEVTREQLERNVAKGARYMDLTDPTWFRPGRYDWAEGGTNGGIDLRELNLGDCSMCILGQRMTNFSAAIDLWSDKAFDRAGRTLKDPAEVEVDMLERAERLGFDAPTLVDHDDPDFVHDRTYTYMLMTALWEREIRTRRELDIPGPSAEELENA